jgi:hypothetical protein
MIATLFRILKDTNLFEKLNDADYKNVRKQMIAMILSTDLAKHGDFLATFQKTLEKGFLWTDPNDVLQVMILSI